MRKLTSAVFVLALAGCAANPQPSQISPAAGLYKLIAVDNQAVPQVIASGEEIVDGALLLNGDGSFELKTSRRTQMSATEPLSYQRQLAGTYTASTIGVQLNWKDGANTSGAFFGRTLRFYHAGVEYLFLK